MSKKIFECHLDITNDNHTAIDWLAGIPEVQNIPKQALKSIMQKGAVWLSLSKTDAKPLRIRRAKRLLKTGNILHLYYNKDVLNTTISPAKLIADCEKYSVWHKPKGMLSQGSKWGDHTTLNRWVEQNYRPNGLHSGQNKNAIIVHRLDKATDGLMLIAHTKDMAKQLSQLFENRKIIKIYQAWVVGKFPAIKQDYLTSIDGRKAVTNAKLLQFDSEKNRSLLEVNIATGRKHQIRIHLAEAGYPIIGDRLYNPSKDHKEDLQLTAVQIELQGDIDLLQKTFKLDGCF